MANFLKKLGDFLEYGSTGIIIIKVLSNYIDLGIHVELSAGDLVSFWFVFILFGEVLDEISCELKVKSKKRKKLVRY